MDGLQTALFVDGEMRAAPVYVPTPAAIAGSALTAFIRFCEDVTGLCFQDQASFHRFSVADYPVFWQLF